jgi:hypothetical protein
MSMSGDSVVIATLTVPHAPVCHRERDRDRVGTGMAPVVRRGKAG